MTIARPMKSALNSHVLVLNRFCMAVHLVTVRHAFLLLCRNCAEVVDQEDGQFAHYDFNTWQELSVLREEIDDLDLDLEWVQTVSHPIQVPRVIRLTEFEQVARQTLRFSRRNLFARDKQRCQYCGQNLTMSQMSMDHVIPRSLGGETRWDNVVCSCVDCNTRKGGRTPKQARMQLKTKPIRPNHHSLIDLSVNHPKYAIWQIFLPQVARQEATVAS